MYSYFYGFHPCYFKIKDGFTRKLLRLACLPIPPLARTYAGEALPFLCYFRNIFENNSSFSLKLGYNPRFYRSLDSTAYHNRKYSVNPEYSETTTLMLLWVQ